MDKVMISPRRQLYALDLYKGRYKRGYIWYQNSTNKNILFHRGYCGNR